MTQGPRRRPADRVVKDLVTRPGSPYCSSDRLVAMALGDHLNADGHAWPSVARLEAWTGLTTRTVQSALARLCSGPLAIFERTVGRGGRTSCRYQLVAEGVQQVHVSRGAIDAPLDVGAQPLHPRGAINAPPISRTPNRTPNGLQPPNPLASEGGSEAAAERRRIADRLRWAERFWISLGGTMDRKDRRALRDLIRGGHGEGEIARGISQAVADQLRRAGKLGWDEDLPQAAVDPPDRSPPAAGQETAGPTPEGRSGREAARSER